MLRIFEELLPIIRNFYDFRNFLEFQEFFRHFLEFSGILMSFHAHVTEFLKKNGIS
jgi:hypothetical protein